MSNNDLVLYGGILAVVVVVIVYLVSWKKEKDSLQKTPQEPVSSGSLNLKLGAYERMVLLTERISLPSLISRVPAGELTVRQLQGVLVDQIKTEFDYNLSQQIYVAPQAWQAVNNLKEQNIFIINKVAENLQPSDRGVELSKLIIELVNKDPNVSLHPVVLEALNFEAKKLL
jgi:hypothetical protein